MQTIVLATDFSEASENAYRYCLEIGSKTRTQIFVAHIYRHQLSVALSEEKKRRYHEKEFEEFQHRTIRFSRLYPDSTTPELHAHCQVSTDIEEGRASSKLLELIQRHHADVLVLGAKSHPGLFRKLFGQVSERLIYSPVCPVLIVPEEYKGNYPASVGALCMDSLDRERLRRWSQSTPLFDEIEVEYFLFESSANFLIPDKQTDGSHTVPRDSDELLMRLEEADVGLFVIQSRVEAEEDRKSLIHYLYDHLSSPLLCVPENIIAKKE